MKIALFGATGTIGRRIEVSGTFSLVAREWAVLQREFEMFPNFVGYVDSLQPRHSR